MEEILNDKPIFNFLSLLPRNQHLRAIHALLLIGVNVVQQSCDLRQLRIEHLEDLAYSADPVFSNPLMIKQFLSEIDLIKGEIYKLDNKIENRLPSNNNSIYGKSIPERRKPLVPLSSHSKESTLRSKGRSHSNKKAGLNSNIYPSWWANQETTQRSQYKKHGGSTEKYNRELEMSAIAAENLMSNQRLSQLNPVTMVFGKEEFKDVYANRRPNPLIVEKQRAQKIVDQNEQLQYLRQSAEARRHSQEKYKREQVVEESGSSENEEQSHYISRQHQPHEMQSPDTMNKVAPTHASMMRHRNATEMENEENANSYSRDEKDIYKYSVDDNPNYQNNVPENRGPRGLYEHKSYELTKNRSFINDRERIYTSNAAREEEYKSREDAPRYKL